MKYTKGNLKIDQESDGQLWIVSDLDETKPMMKVCQGEIVTGINSSRMEITEENKGDAKLACKASKMYEALEDEKMFLAEILMRCEDANICNDISIRMSRIKSLLKEIEK